MFQRSLTPPQAVTVVRESVVPVAALRAAVALLFGGLVLAVARLDAAIPLGIVVVLCVLVVPLLLWPDLATITVVFLLYTNVPVLATQHGVPVVVASAFLLLLGIPLLSHVVLRRERIRADWPLLLMLMLLVVMLLSGLGAKGPAEAADYVQTYVLEGIVLYWLVINAVRNHDSLLRAVWTLLAAGALLGALATYQEVTGAFEQQFGGLAQRNVEYLELQQLDVEDPATIELRESFEGVRNSRAEGPMNEPNRFAQVLLVLLPLALLAYRAARHRWSRLGAAGAALLLVFGMMCSGSRAAFAVLVMLTLFAGYVRWVRRSHLLVGAAVLALLVPIVAPRYLARIQSIASVTAIGSDADADGPDGAIRGRMTEMFAAAQTFADHPVLGVGPGQYLHFYSLAYQQKDPRLRFRDIQTVRRAHSLYLELAAELGVVGLAVFLAIFAFLLRGLNGVRRRCALVRPELADLATAFGFSLLAFLGTSVFLHLSFQRYHWLLVALASAALHVLRGAERTGRVVAV